MNPRFFADLRRHEVRTAAEMMAAAQRARVTLRDRIKAAGRQAINAKFRDAFFGKVSNIYRLLSGELDAILKGATGKTANMARKAFFEARVAAGETVRAKVIQFSPERLERYWGMIHPDNAPTLAATSKMATDEVQGLRNAVVQVFRQGDLEAWTANTRAKKLQEAWDAVAGDANPRRFVDGAGREWSNARYLQMLVRTTQARVSREALIDTTVENGDDLMRVVTAGDNCPICQTWGGLIVSVTGTNEKFPSYEAAIEAGLFHPNCLPGDALVDVGNVRAAFRARFNGDIVRITTEGGAVLRAAPRHPVLTPEGWIESQAIKAGATVFRATGADFVGRKTLPISEVFDRMARTVGAGRFEKPALPTFFHGDGASVQGAVDIVGNPDPDNSERAFTTLEPAIVASVEREHFDGYVYDLSTAEGCYSAGDSRGLVMVSNCDCSLERIDETIDETDAQNQGDAKTPPDLSDLEALREYRAEAGLDAPDAPGEEPGTFAREAAAAYRGEVED